MTLIADLLVGLGVYGFVACILLFGSGSPVDVASQRRADDLRRRSSRPAAPDPRPRPDPAIAGTPFTFIALGHEGDSPDEWRTVA